MGNNRIEMRVTEDHKALVEKAAATVGQTVTAFATATLLERAHQVLAQHEITVLSLRDRKVFLQILDAGKPNDALKKAAARFKANHVRR